MKKVIALAVMLMLIGLDEANASEGHHAGFKVEDIIICLGTSPPFGTRFTDTNLLRYLHSRSMHRHAKGEHYDLRPCA